MYYRSGSANVFYSGDTSHSLAEHREFSFDFLGTMNGPTGIAAIKFSGDSGISSFTLKGGKIFDPEGRYVSSYRDREQFLLSGTMSGTHYDYYINHFPICFSGTKTDYKLQKFIVGVTGAEFSTERIAFYAPPFGYKFDLDPTFKISGKITGLLQSTGEWAYREFEVFSGEVTNNDLFVVSGIETGLRTSCVITLATTGTTSGNLETGVIDYENFNLDLDLYTNFGKINSEFSVQGIPLETAYITSGLFDSHEGDLFSYSPDFSISGTGQQKQSGVYSFFYQVFENYQTYLESKPLKVSFDHASGTTGNFYSFSGEPPASTGVYSGTTGYINLTASGSNYTSAPSVIFTGSGLQMSPVAPPLMDLRLTGIDITYSGSGYSGVPTVLISGGNPFTSGQVTAYTNLTTGGLYSGMISGTTITNSGSGYNAVPSVIFTGSKLYGGGIEATGNALMGLGIATGIILNNPGGYLAHQPGLSGIIGGGASGRLSSISVTNSGSKYISAPTVVFSSANRVREAVATGLIVTTGAYSGLVTGIHIADKGLGYESTPSIVFTGALYAGGYNATGTATLDSTVAAATGYTISGYSKSFTDFWNLKTGESTGVLVDYTNNNYLTGFQSGQRIGFMDTGHTNVTGDNYKIVAETSGRYNDSGAMYANLNLHIYSGKKLTVGITGMR